MISKIRRFAKEKIGKILAITFGCAILGLLGLLFASPFFICAFAPKIALIKNLIEVFD